MKRAGKGIKTEPLWTSYMQCLKAVSDYWKLGHTTAAIFGGTGHAFVLNVHPELCPSGVTCFSTEPLDRLAGNLGLSVNTTIFTQSFEDFKTLQKDTWEKAKVWLDRGLPLIGWDLKIPEYYIIYGYDEEHYLYSDIGGEARKLKWNKLGKGETTIANIKAVEVSDSAADLNTMLKDAFSFALEFAKGKKQWVFPGYVSGRKAYTVWIEALKTGKGNHWGGVYNAQVWSECRSYASAFLKEAKKKLRSALLDKLIEHYDVIDWSLQRVAEIYKPGNEYPDEAALETAVDNLFLAQEAEKAALAEMKLILSQL